MKTISWICLPLIAVIIGSCDTEPVFSPNPKIAFIDIQPREVVQLRDSILITFRFQDGDGDLGRDPNSDNPNDNSNLILLDSRFGEGRITELQASNVYTLPNLTPQARNPSIQGEITINLPPTAIIPPRFGDDSVRYQIKLYDRAGNLATPIDGSEGAIYTDYIKILRN